MTYLWVFFSDNKDLIVDVIYFFTVVGLLLFVLNLKALFKEKEPRALIHKTSIKGFGFITNTKKITGRQGLVFASGESVGLGFPGKSGDYEIVFPKSVFKDLFKIQRAKNKVLALFFSTVACLEGAYTTKLGEYIIIDCFAYVSDKRIDVLSAHTAKYKLEDLCLRILNFSMISAHKWLIPGVFFLTIVNITFHFLDINLYEAQWVLVFTFYYTIGVCIAFLLWVLVVFFRLVSWFACKIKKNKLLDLSMNRK